MPECCSIRSECVIIVGKRDTHEDFCSRLIDSIPKRLNEVFEAHGDVIHTRTHTDYVVMLRERER